MTPDARPRRRLAPEVRRRQVLDAAVAVFSEEGFHDASMDAVAARAGVSKPMVYAHGGTKEELFSSCLRQEGDRLLRTVTAAVSTVDGSGGRGSETRLWLGLRAFFGAVTTRRAGWAVLYRQASTGAFAGEIAAMRALIVERVATLLAEGLATASGEETVPASTVSPLAHTLVGAAEGLADWWLGNGGTAITDERTSDTCTGGPPRVELAADQLASTLMGVVWPGIDALRSGRVWTPPIAPSTAVSTER